MCFRRPTSLKRTRVYCRWRRRVLLEPNEGSAGLYIKRTHRSQRENRTPEDKSGVCIKNPNHLGP